ncbi:MAG: protein kinase [Acidobacteria bacterium]|nr:protein kinase [Acidobacteriota bacterium]
MEHLLDLESLFYEALDRDLEDRDAYLEEACFGDQELVSRIKRLLDCDARVGNSLDDMVLAFTDVDDEWKPDMPPGFQFIKKLGSGGMGDVFLAEQQQPKRRVAVKFLKHALQAASARRRFEAESEVMARLNHASIAAVYEVGMQQAHPYIVMEFVDGVPIHEFAHQLDLTEKLALFTQVCTAVQHAHQKGVIHRDLKPTNILVDDGVAKVIDFGIAKSMESRSVQNTGGLVPLGTPGYMSPEQLSGNEDTDTRSDIYSLGILLHELIAGKPLWHGNHVSPLHWIQSIQKGLEKGLPRLSSSIADPELKRKVKGELDWIVAKATASHPDHRYASVRDLIQDIENYHQNLPIQARPPSFAYLFKTTMRRHKWIMAGSCILLLSASVAIAGVIAGLVQSREAERRAIAAKDRAEQTLSYFTQRLALSTPEQMGGNLTVSEMLQTMEQGLDHDLSANPELKHQFELALAEMFFASSDYDRALQLSRKSDAYFSNEQTVSSADAAFQLGRAEAVFDRQAGVQQLDKALNQYVSVLGNTHEKTLTCRAELALRLAYHDPNRALDEIEAVIQLRQSSGDQKAVTKASLDRARILFLVGEYDAANQAFAQLLPTARIAFGEQHMQVLRSSHDFAHALQVIGRLQEAQVLLEEISPILAERFGEHHFNTLLNREIALGNLLRMKLLDMPVSISWDELSQQMHTLIVQYQSFYPWIDVDHLIEDQAHISMALGDLNEAKSLVMSVRVRLDPESPNYVVRNGWTLCLLAQIESTVGDPKKSLDLFRLGFHDWRSSQGTAFWHYMKMRYAIAYQLAGESDQAQSLLRATYGSFCNVTLDRGIFRRLIDHDLVKLGLDIK